MLLHTTYAACGHIYEFVSGRTYIILPYIFSNAKYCLDFFSNPHDHIYGPHIQNRINMTAKESVCKRPHMRSMWSHLKTNYNFINCYESYN